MSAVSVVVVCLNEEANITECLESLVGQRGLTAPFEVVVVDGGSRDRTQEMIAPFMTRDPRVRLVVEPRRGTAIGRNAGVAAAQYDRIAFIDADCLAPDDWLSRLIYHFDDSRTRDPRVVAVGGSNLPPPGSSRFVQAIGVALDSYVGSFNSAQGRQFVTPRLVASLPALNVLYDKQAILAVGGFDDSLGSDAEDAELNFRLQADQWHFLYIPGLPVWHRYRPTPAVWFRNMFRYGRGRARLLKRYPSMWQVSYLLPPLFLVTLASLLLLPLSPWFGVAAGYFPAMLLVAAHSCRRHQRWELIGEVFLVLTVQHLGYALGEVYGLLHRGVR